MSSREGGAGGECVGGCAGLGSAAGVGSGFEGASVCAAVEGRGECGGGMSVEGRGESGGGMSAYGLLMGKRVGFR